MDTVLILNYHPVYRSGIKLLLLYEFSANVLEAGNGQEALELLREYKVDLVVMDAALPDMECHEAVQWISTVRPGLPVIVLASLPDMDSPISTLAGCVPPACTRQVFMDAVRTALYPEKV